MGLEWHPATRLFPSGAVRGWASSNWASASAIIPRRWLRLDQSHRTDLLPRFGELTIEGDEFGGERRPRHVQGIGQVEPLFDRVEDRPSPGMDGPCGDLSGIATAGYSLLHDRIGERGRDPAGHLARQTHVEAGVPDPPGDKLVAFLERKLTEAGIEFKLERADYSELTVMIVLNLSGQTVAFDGDRVRDLVAELARDADLSRFIL